MLPLPRSTLLAVAGWAVLLLVGLAGRIGAAPPGITVESGFERSVRGGYAPVRVTIQTTDEGFDGELRVHYRLQQPHTALVRRVSVPPRSQQAVSLCVPIDAPGRQVILRAVAADGRTEEFPLETRWVSGSRLILVITESSGGLEPLTANPGDAEKESGPKAAAWDISYFTPAQAPVHWQAYKGVDFVVLHLPEPARFSDAQVRALQRWVELGGHLAVVLGTRPVTLDGNWLDALLPCAVAGNVEIDSLSDLDRRYGHPSTPIRRTAVARLEPREHAWADAAQAGKVLSCTIRRGGGRVTAVAFDYQSAPFKEHTSARRLFGELPAGGVKNLWETLDYSLGNRLARDLSAQYALEWSVAVWLIVLLVAYVAALRPIQRRLFTPPVTLRRIVLWMPGLPVAVSLLVAAFVVFAPRGTTAARTLGVLFVQPDSAFAESHTYLTLFSPIEHQTAVRFDEPDAVVDQECGNKLDLALAAGYTYRQEDPSRLDGVRLLPAIPRTFLISSSRTLAGPWVVRVERDVASEGWVVSGQNRTGFDLEDVRIAFVGKEALVGDWKAGEVFERRPLPLEDWVPPTPAGIWSDQAPDLRAAVLEEMYDELDLDRLPKPDEPPRTAYITGWTSLPPDARLDVGGSPGWRDDSLLYQSISLKEEK